MDYQEFKQQALAKDPELAREYARLKTEELLSALKKSSENAISSKGNHTSKKDR